MPDFRNPHGEEFDDTASDKAWVPDDALASLVSERELNPDESDEQLTRRLFKENSAKAALQIVFVSNHGTNERTRLDASKYIVERVLGKIGDDVFEGAKNPLEALMEDVLEQAEAFANSNISSSSSNNSSSNSSNPYTETPGSTPDNGKGILDENR